MQQLPYSTTAVHVLHKEFFSGNVVILDLMTLEVDRYTVETREQLRQGL